MTQIQNKQQLYIKYIKQNIPYLKYFILEFISFNYFSIFLKQIRDSLNLMKSHLKTYSQLNLSKRLCPKIQPQPTYTLYNNNNNNSISIKEIPKYINPNNTINNTNTMLDQQTKTIHQRNSYSIEKIKIDKYKINADIHNTRYSPSNIYYDNLSQFNNISHKQYNKLINSVQVTQTYTITAMQKQKQKQKMQNSDIFDQGKSKYVRSIFPCQTYTVNKTNILKSPILNYQNQENTIKNKKNSQDNNNNIIPAFNSFQAIQNKQIIEAKNTFENQNNTFSKITIKNQSIQQIQQNNKQLSNKLIILQQQLETLKQGTRNGQKIENIYKHKYIQKCTQLQRIKTKLKYQQQYKNRVIQQKQKLQRQKQQMKIKYCTQQNKLKQQKAEIQQKYIKQSELYKRQQAQNHIKAILQFKIQMDRYIQINKQLQVRLEQEHKKSIDSNYKTLHLQYQMQLKYNRQKNQIQKLKKQNESLQQANDKLKLQINYLEIAMNNIKIQSLCKHNDQKISQYKLIKQCFQQYYNQVYNKLAIFDNLFQQNYKLLSEKVLQLNKSIIERGRKMKQKQFQLTQKHYKFLQFLYLKLENTVQMTKPDLPIKKNQNIQYSKLLLTKINSHKKQKSNLNKLKDLQDKLQVKIQQIIKIFLDKIKLKSSQTIKQKLSQKQRNPIEKLRESLELPSTIQKLRTENTNKMKNLQIAQEMILNLQKKLRDSYADNKKLQQKLIQVEIQTLRLTQNCDQINKNLIISGLRSLDLKYQKSFKHLKF